MIKYIGYNVAISFDTDQNGYFGQWNYIRRC